MKKLAAFAVLVLIFGAGCVSNSTGGLEVALAEGGGQATIRIDDKKINKLISVENTIVRRRENGFLEANVQVRNCSKNVLSIQYKFKWFDADGMEVQPGGRPWELKTDVHGGEQVTLSATAPEKSGVKFLLRLRQNR